MRQLVFKLVRDLRSNLGQFVSVALVAALGVAFFTALLTVRTSLTETLYDFYHDLGLADVWVERTGTDAAGVAAIGQLDGVAEAEGRLQLSASAHWGGTDKTLVAYTLTERVNRLFVATGALPERPSQCAFDQAFLGANSLALGSSVTVVLADRDLVCTVTAGVYSPEHVNPLKDPAMATADHMDYGLLYLHPDLIADLADGLFNQIVLSTAPGATAGQVMDELAGSPGLIRAFDRDQQSSYATINYKLASVEQMATVLPIVFFLAVAGLVFISLSRIVSAQRSQIGLMKALGTPPSVIFGHYLLIPVCTGLAGGAIGGAVGATVLPGVLLAAFAVFFDLPAVTRHGGALLAVAGTVAVIAAGSLAAFASGRSILRAVPARLLAPEPAKPGRRVALERCPRLWGRLSLSSRLVWRNLLGAKRRLALGSAGIIGGCALILSAAGLQGTMTAATDDLVSGVQCYDMQVTLERPQAFGSPARLTDPAIWTADPVALLGAVVDPDGMARDVSLTVLPADSASIRLVDPDGAPLSLGEGVIVTAKLARQLDVAPGQTIRAAVTVGPTPTEVDLPVAAIARAYILQGLYASWETFAGLGLDVPVTGYYLLLDPAADPEAVATSVRGQPGVGSVLTKDAIATASADAMGMLTVFVAAMLIASGVLTMAVVFNLTTINLAERRRDIATLRVLGSTWSEVRRLILTENLCLTAFGAIVGVAVGLILQAGLIHLIGSDDFDLPYLTIWWSVPLAVAGVFAFTLVTNAILRGRIHRVDLVESLKGVE
ncbi:MAG: FtsX-like permease family protein [Propionibacteriaceae bacterium]|nr:FtsX-like permease family protein [Propionibacteriaceae bacterium]